MTKRLTPNELRIALEERIVTLAKILKVRILGPDTQDLTGIFLERGTSFHYRMMYRTDSDGENDKPLFDGNYMKMKNLCEKLDSVINVAIMFDLEPPKKAIAPLCPCCQKDGLCVDERYMRATHGEDYVKLNFSDLVFDCRLCDAWGTLKEMESA